MISPHQFRFIMWGFAITLLALYFQPVIQSYLTGLSAEPRTVTARGTLAEDEKSTIELFKMVSPSVAYITTISHVRSIWSRNITRTKKGTGSAFIWDRLGHVVTNYHVLEEAHEARVTLSDQRTYPAVLVGASREHDLAVLRIDAGFNPPPPVPLGTSSDLQVGQKVFAIGNPFGLDHTLTTGVISALDRSIDNDVEGTIDHLIQTDAAINPGNSGGPLLDSAGRLIGINTAIYSSSGGYMGIGFAVPVDTVNRVVPVLIAQGRYQKPTIGISGNDDVSRRILEEVETEGILVLGVTRGSGAERAGLRPTTSTSQGILLGDVIQAVNDQPVASLEQLQRRLDDFSIGDSVELTLWRQGQSERVLVQLGR